MPNVKVGGLKKVFGVSVLEFERMTDELESDEDGIKGLFLRYLGVVKSPERNKR
jgi:hypothetical protein